MDNSSKAMQQGKDDFNIFPVDNSFLETFFINDEEGPLENVETHDNDNEFVEPEDPHAEEALANKRARREWVGADPDYEPPADEVQGAADEVQNRAHVN